jgi:hypothetical protein
MAIDILRRDFLTAPPPRGRLQRARNSRRQFVR